MKYLKQSVAVLGCGLSGVAAAKLAAREGAEVTVFDSGRPEGLAAAAAEVSAAGCGTVFGDAALDAAAGGFDLAVTSPGIALEWPLCRQFSDAGVRVVGELEFAFPFCEADIVGVTGTNGKTTTVELVAAMLGGCGESAVAAGNYGRPLSDVVCSDEGHSVIALEVSSFQLEAIETFRPDIALWTNFAPDHLDRYPDVGTYRDAKLRLFENQTPADWAVLNARDDIPPVAARTLTFSAFDGGADYSYRGGEIRRGGEPVMAMADTELRGTHNAENLMAAFAVAEARGHAPDVIAASVAGYRAPAHRCELVAILDGVEYINDSKATNLHALESALLALSDSEIVLIAGGKDKGLPFGDLADCVAEHARAAVLIGEIRERLAAEWGARLPCHTASDIGEAVGLATRLAEGRGLVLFAPGTSSFDMFSGYEARGRAFREAVNWLT